RPRIRWCASSVYRPRIRRSGDLAAIGAQSAPGVLVGADRRAYYRFAIHRRFLEDYLVMLAVGFDLAQAHQQVVPVPGEPQGGFALGIGLAYPFHLHRIELAVAGGHPLVA